MATDNKRVATYLPPDLYEHLQAFRQERDLGESKALIQILSEYFGVSRRVAQDDSLKIFERLELLEQGLAALAKRFEASLRDEIAGQSSEWFPCLPESSREEALSIVPVVSQQQNNSGQMRLLEGEPLSSSIGEPPKKADGERWLTGTQAFQVASSRGCARNSNGFSKWAKRNPDKCLKDFGLRRFDSLNRGSNIAPTFEDMAWNDESVEF